MEFLLRSIVLISFYFVLTLAQSQSGNSGEQLSTGPVSPHPNLDTKLNHLKNSEPARINGGYTSFRTTIGNGNGAAPTPQTYTTYGGYTQDTNPYGGTYSPPIFGLSSNGDFQFAAYFGPIFWGCVAAVILIAIALFLARLFGGFEKLGGLVKNIGEKTASGKSLDLDKLTTMVYHALDKYGNWNST